MCRFLAWTGAPRYFDELVLNQEQSLVEQSRNAMIGKTPINADGFGLAWYSERDRPCFYKDTNPAWSDANLRQLAQNDSGVKYMYQEAFDANLEQHRLLGENLSSAPDAIIGIFWCQPTGADSAPRFTGGYAYLKVVDGEWKFHTR